MFSYTSVTQSLLLLSYYHKCAGLVIQWPWQLLIFVLLEAVGSIHYILAKAWFFCLAWGRGGDERRRKTYFFRLSKP